MSDVKFGFPHAKATDKVMDKYKHDTSIKSFEDLADVIDGEFLEVYKELFLAFSTLSDATTLLLDFDDVDTKRKFWKFILKGEESDEFKKDNKE